MLHTLNLAQARLSHWKVSKHVKEGKMARYSLQQRIVSGWNTSSLGLLTRTLQRYRKSRGEDEPSQVRTPHSLQQHTITPCSLDWASGSFLPLYAVTVQYRIDAKTNLLALGQISFTEKSSSFKLSSNQSSYQVCSKPYLFLRISSTFNHIYLYTSAIVQFFCSPSNRIS